MGKPLRAAGAAFLLSLSFVAHALDGSQCKQSGGGSECWSPTVGPWHVSACPTVVDSGQLDAAICKAQGGTFTTTGCINRPPDARPTSEGDVGAYATEVFQNFWGSALCGGAGADGPSWGGTVASEFCYFGSGPTFDATFGIEIGNVAPDFLVKGSVKFGDTCE